MTTTSTSNTISTSEQIYIAFTNTPTAGLVLGGKNTSHNCYDDAPEQCAKLWQDQGGKLLGSLFIIQKIRQAKLTKLMSLTQQRKENRI